MNLDNTYIGFDWDGTLELFDIKPTPELIALFQNLQSRGARLFLASGKTCSALERVSQGIIEPFLIAGESGGHIRIPEQGLEYFSEPDEDLLKFAALVKACELPSNQPQRIEKATIWCRMFGDNATQAAAILRGLIAKHNLHLDVFPHPEIDGAVDVAPRDVNKANVLKHLPLDARIYYFGDGGNDIALLGHERVFPCTMINANPEVKALVESRKGKIATQPACLGVYEILKALF
jgi:HAD superfamily hydrolase (TIGR01484 family)